MVIKPKLTKKILICGLGSIGKRHLKIIKDNWPNIKVACLRNKNPDYYPSSINDFLIEEFFYNINEAKEWNPDAVIISNPAKYHLKYALFFAELSKPLFIEKPIGIGNEPNKYREKLSEYSKKSLILCGYVLRFDEGINLLKEKAQKIGKLVTAEFYCGSWLPNWRDGIDYRNSVSASKDLGGGVLLELSHELDLANWLIGPYEINYSYLKNTGLLDLDVEDCAMINAVSVTGCVININLNFCTKTEKRTIKIIGSEGNLEYDLIKNQLLICISNEEESYQLNQNKNQKYINQMEHFIECIENSEDPTCTVKDGFQVLNHVSKAKSFDNIKENL